LCDAGRVDDAAWLYLQAGVSYPAAETSVKIHRPRLQMVIAGIPSSARDQSVARSPLIPETCCKTGIFVRFAVLPAVHPAAI
jgi:hypothetical protein